MINDSSKWIWRDGEPAKNEFVRFEGSFSYSGGTALLSIAAETDYIAYVNGCEAAFGQYAGYPELKFFDEVNISAYCATGDNTLSLIVRYEGVNSATHIDDGAGVIFSVEEDGVLLLYSSENTHSALSENYVSGDTRVITRQLGLAADMAIGDPKELSRSVTVSKTKNIKKRPVKKCVSTERVPAKLLSGNIYDLGREYSGHLYLKYKSDYDGMIRVAYGEHIADGGVRYLIAERNFSLSFHAKRGEGEFCQRFVKVAARYLKVDLPPGCEVLEIGIIPHLYPVTEKEHGLSGLDGKIYDACVRTLRLCMGTHYEDCPWREQALYVLDARNQMLAGYNAFLETEFPRANLVLISHGVRDDGLLELTFPAKNTPAIPFFSLMYPVAVYEYIENTGDKSILDEIWATLEKIVSAFLSRVDENGLVKEFEPPFWNFYEWTVGSSGSNHTPSYSLILNCALVYSIERYSKLAVIRGIDFTYDTSAIKKAIEREFLDTDCGLFSLFDTERDKFSELGQAFALLIGLGDERTARALKSGELIPASLSTLCFVYDALLTVDEKNAEFVLDNIRQKYAPMLNVGTVWETENGEAAFNKAGSLCHGWSAMPIYFLKKLLKKSE